MQDMSDMTIGDALRGLYRYRPLLLVVLAIWLIVTLMPGKPPRIETTQQQSLEGAGDRAVAAGPGAQSAVQPGQDATTGSALVRPVSTRVITPRTQGSSSTDFGPNCDLVTGRVKVPTIYAVPCVPPHTGSNFGNTYQGVTKDTINVIVYRGQANAAATAIVTAAGADDSREQVAETRQAYVDLWEKHLETYGRKVNIEYIEGSGAATDDAAGKADAIRVATEKKAFASWGSPNNAYVEELVARKVICICTTSLPIDLYLKWAPYAGYTTLMASTQGYVHRAEYIGKRLWGKKARFAGDATYQLKTRTFAIVYFETRDNAYKSGVDFFERELGRYGARMEERIAYVLDLAQAQETARTIIAKLKSKDITSVVFSGDPLMPIFLTQEATNQRYNPEWVITGSALTDTGFFARTYDKQQWSHAFGVSYLPARLPQELGDAYRLHVWHHNKPPVADDTYGVIYPTPTIFMRAVHMAGAKLTPQTFRDGLFAIPPAGGGPTTPLTSFGQWGFWPWDDYLSYDDATDIWWDPVEPGEDETGATGVGMYRYMDGGRRYLPGAWPSPEPRAFDKTGTVVVYQTVPPEDKWPEYTHQPH